MLINMAADEVIRCSLKSRGMHGCGAAGDDDQEIQIASFETFYFKDYYSLTHLENKQSLSIYIYSR